MFKGQLCYIPQDVYLVQENNRKYHKTEKPINAVVVECNSWDKWFKILYKNEIWDVSLKHTYPLEENVSKIDRSL